MTHLLLNECPEKEIWAWENDSLTEESDQHDETSKHDEYGANPTEQVLQSLKNEI